MARSSRSSTALDYKALSNGERKERKSEIEERPRKRQRTRDKARETFDFASVSSSFDEDEENDDPQLPHKRRSSARLHAADATPEVKRTDNGRKVNGTPATPSKVLTNGKSRKVGRAFSPSPAVSAASSDELTSSRTPLTASKRQARSGSNIKSEKPVTDFNKRLNEGTGHNANNAPANVQVEEEPVEASPPRSKSKRSGQGPSAAEFERIKQHILGKLCARIPISLTGKAVDISKDIHEIMTRAIEGESNSLLLLGGPGSGKSAIVADALAKVKAEHPDPGKFYTIRLDGQVQLDDKIALKEIARQLALEMNIEMEKEMSFADTLTTFLYTLNHPNELSSEATQDRANTTSASVIFILDHFDEFLSHPRQALLYNLFDIAQSRKAPIAVICLGRKVNAIDGLEKRVKSRFGGRIKQVSRPTDLEEFWKVCQAALSVDSEDSTFAREWNGHVQGLWRDNGMKELCREIFVESRDVREFFSRSIPVISSLSLDTTTLPTAKAWTSQSMITPEPKLHLVDGLSQLELGLLISATRLETFHALETFNFNMVYEIYTSLVSRARTRLSAITALGVQTVIPGGAVQLWGRDVSFRAWERLGEIGLWTYSVRGEGRGRFVRCEIDLVELSSYCEKRKLLNSAMRSWFKDAI